MGKEKIKVKQKITEKINSENVKDIADAFLRLKEPTIPESVVYKRIENKKKRKVTSLR